MQDFFSNLSDAAAHHEQPATCPTTAVHNNSTSRRGGQRYSGVEIDDFVRLVPEEREAYVFVVGVRYRSLAASDR